MNWDWYSLGIGIVLAALLPGAEYIYVRTAASKRLRRFAQLPRSMPVMPATAQARLLELLPRGSSIDQIEAFLRHSRLGRRRTWRDTESVQPGIAVEIDPGPGVLNVTHQRFSILFRLDAQRRLVDILVQQEVR